MRVMSRLGEKIDEPWRQLTNISGTQHQAGVARTGMTGQKADTRIAIVGEGDGAGGETAASFGQRLGKAFGADARNRLLASAVDGQERDRVRLIECGGEFSEAISRAGMPVGLEDHMYPAASQTRSSNGRT
jgi:hypothetical protein